MSEEIKIGIQMAYGWLVILVLAGFLVVSYPSEVERKAQAAERELRRSMNYNPHQEFSDCVVAFTHMTNPTESQFLGGAAASSAKQNFNEIVDFCKKEAYVNRCEISSRSGKTANCIKGST